MRSATLILGLFFVATSAAIPMPRVAAVAASGLNRRDTVVARGEEATADEDVTWNVDLYAVDTAPAERRSFLDARGEEETADEDVTWNVNVYPDGTAKRRSELDARGEEESADEDVTWNVNVYAESSLVIVSVVMPVLVLIATSLRFIAQRHNSILRTPDDILVALNCIILIGSGCLTIVGAIVGGIGADLAKVDGSTIVRFRKIAFASEFFYITTVGIVKLSLLLYYRRIFVLSLVSPGFRGMNDILIGVVCLWILAFFITTFFQARPISWNWTEVGSVSNLHDFFISEAITNIALDLIVLCMPMLVVYRMRMSLRKKMLVVGIFGLGFL
ncbi:hypothetical protein TCE0_044f16819 [Talaromyces pinophilus]|uniref:Rhodopsin domain-containing protein n=1 Tax=Talaromyces pinophilus TaxID=128442 RepID=A0A478ECR2_TALPI|nr:hypothetical protein TCE0_044f16819 [Talaromyces pinophilus]